ncbi:MAG: hypothetical protein ABIQ44_04210 [Chloroflexia bacterium]
MKLQSKLLGGRLGRRDPSVTSAQAATAVAGAGTTDSTDAAKPVVTLNPGMGANLRSLGSELQQAALQSTFEYGKNRILIVKVTSVLLVILSVTHAALTLAPMISGGTWSSVLFSWPALGLALEITIASLVAAVLVNMFPTIKVTPQGLGVAEVTGWHTIPWGQLGVIRVMELGGLLFKGRYLVMIPFTGKTTPSTPAPMLKWMPSLFGASREREQGVMLTSDIKSFERLLQLVVSYMVQAQGGNGTNVVVESFVDEQVTMHTAQLLLDPEAALERLSRYTVATENPDPYAITEVDNDPPVNWSRMLVRQLPIAVLPGLVLLTDVMVRDGSKPFVWLHVAWAVLLSVLGAVELPFVAYLVQAVGELMVGGGKFKRAVWAYADLQVPRAIAVVLGLALLGIGLPAGFSQAFWFAGIAITTVLVTRFVQKLYYMPLAHTIPAAVGAFIYQMLIFALYFGVR